MLIWVEIEAIQAKTTWKEDREGVCSKFEMDSVRASALTRLNHLPLTFYIYLDIHFAMSQPRQGGAVNPAQPAEDQGWQGKAGGMLKSVAMFMAIQMGQWAVFSDTFVLMSSDEIWNVICMCEPTSDLTIARHGG